MIAIGKKTNEELFAEYKNGDESKLEDLFNQNERYLYHMAHKYKNTGIDTEDLASMAKIGMLKAINKFDLSKNIKLATFMATCMDNEIRMYLRKGRREEETSSLQFVIAQGENGEDRTLEDIIAVDEGEFHKDDYIFLGEVLETFSKTASEQDKLILKYRFIDNLKHREIGEKLGFSTSYATRRCIMLEHQLKDIATYGFISDKKVGERKNGRPNINKEELIYIILNYDLSYKEIQNFTGVRASTIENYKHRYNNGTYAHIIPRIDPKVKKKIDHYVNNKEEIL
jgi:RNA polymerase sporulation-specific sigma factor